MQNIFFMDIDTQRDFMLPEGKLYVAGAERIIPKLKRLFDFARKNEITILSSVDAHTEEDVEFQDFPPHCVQGSEGQRKLDETLLPRPLILQNRPIDRNLLDIVRKHQQIIVEKQTLSAFDNPVTERLLRVLPHRAIVFGVATEFCVKMDCMGLRQRGVQTAVISDAIRSMAQKSGKEAVEEMRMEGVEFISLDTLVEASTV